MNNKIRIVHLVLSASRTAGGLYYSVSGITRSLVSKSNDVYVFAGFDKINESDYKIWDDNINMIFFKKIGPNSFGYMPGLLYKLIKLNPDILHIHGIWGYQAFVASIVKLFLKNIKVVISPRGMLDTWSLKRSKFKKKTALFLYVNRLLRITDSVHVLNRFEKEVIKFKFTNTRRFFTLPNGVSSVDDALKTDIAQKIKLIYIGRLHEKKGIELLINSMKILKNKKKIFSLKIAGWGDNFYVNKLKTLIKKNNLEDCVKFVGPLYNDKKKDFLKQAHVFILPSFSEGLPMAVLECWSYGISTFITKNCNFDIEMKMPFVHEINHSEEDIAEKLLKFIDNVKQNNFRQISKAAINHINKLYLWDILGKKLTTEYLSLINENNKNSK